MTNGRWRMAGGLVSGGVRLAPLSLTPEPSTLIPDSLSGLDLQGSYEAGQALKPLILQGIRGQKLKS